MCVIKYPNKAQRVLPEDFETETPRHIDNKEKMASAGNWGHPRAYTKKHTNINYGPEIPRHKGRKRKKKKPYVSSWATCPFCEAELRIDKEAPICSMSERESKCRICGAKEVPVCPACKFSIWRNNQGYYKHQGGGCGFYGKKRVEREMVST